MASGRGAACAARALLGMHLCPPLDGLFEVKAEATIEYPNAYLSSISRSRGGRHGS